MGLDTIPTRASKTTITTEWANVIKRALVGDVVPRNSSGVPTDDAGSMGTSTYRWGALYSKAIKLWSNNHIVSMIAPSGLASDYTLTIPSNLPTGGEGNRYLQATQAGVMGYGSPVPVGAVLPFAGTTLPTGFLFCDGSAVSRATYAALYAVILETHGNGNGTTTFNLPDYGGRFLRGVTTDIARDPNYAGRTAMNTGGASAGNVGSIQGHATALPGTNFTTSSDGAHTHTYTRTDPIGGSGTIGVNSSAQNLGGAGTSSSDGAHTHSVTGGGDSETRPKNAFVNFIIKT